MPRNLEQKFRSRIPSQERDADIVEWEIDRGTGIEREKERARSEKGRRRL
jgi:hypothetical protein